MTISACVRSPCLMSLKWTSRVCICSVMAWTLFYVFGVFVVIDLVVTCCVSLLLLFSLSHALLGDGVDLPRGFDRATQRDPTPSNQI